MSAPDSQQLTTGTVAPGQEIDVAFDLIAPDDPGEIVEISNCATLVARFLAGAAKKNHFGSRL